MNTVEVSFKKSFVSTSDNGLTFHWLRSIYFDALEEAVDNAVRLVYSPSVLAASPNTQQDVPREVAYCRDGFEEMMALAFKVLKPDSTLPEFAGSYPAGSSLGKIYQ
jgi:hypothetical protein